MYLTIRQQTGKFSKRDYRILRKLSHAAKNLTNEAIYNVRQHFFKTRQYLSYNENYKLLRSNSNYKKLNANMAQQIIREVDGMFQSFFALLQKKKEDKNFSVKTRFPGYLPKDGFATLIIGLVRLKRNTFTLPYSKTFGKTHEAVKITIPPTLKSRQVKEIRIIPKYNARFFEIQYIYEVAEEQRELTPTKALAIDLGITNLASCVTTEGKAFILDGRKLKAINQWYNKENARLQSIKDKQHYGAQMTIRQRKLAMKRNNRVNDYISKVARYIINYCLREQIGVVVCGYNADFQRGANLGEVTNQNFVNISFGKLQDKLRYLCRLYGIKYVEQEESYTSKASFWDMDELPVYSTVDAREYKFSGRRVYRGLYRRADGYEMNADLNGALNILRKSRVVSLETLYSRGAVDTPVRIRVA